MDINKKIIGLGIVGIFILSCLSGCTDQPGINSGTIIIPAVSGVASSNPKYAMASYYTAEEITIDAEIPEYTLPLTISGISNYNDVDAVLSLSSSQKDLLEANGFVVKDYGMQDDIIQAYKDMESFDVPIFVTSDTLLHLYHIQFDEILKAVEEREFFEDILDLSAELFEKSKSDYTSFTDDDLKEASRRNVGFFGVGLSLLQTPTEDYDGSENIREISFSIPEHINDNITEELIYIENHDGFHDSPLFFYKEDYSQYVPRGHYTQSEKLKRYFKAMMWYGRLSFLMKGGEPFCESSICDFLISEYNAKIQTVQASLMATALPVVEANGESLQELWNRIYMVTSFFVGTSDDLTPYEYLDCIERVFGSEFEATAFTDDEQLLALKRKLVELRSPEIYGGTGNVLISKEPVEEVTVEDLYEVLEKTKGMRLMGQRFIPDSYMFQQLVAPAVHPYIGYGEPFTMEITQAGPTRAFPRGLDVMAVLGSERAVEILEEEGDTEYDSYDDQLEKLQQNFSQLNISEWNKNLYFSWIYTLKSLIKQSDELTPTFMQTTAWNDKQLHTALSSWAELRHDTILYGKQSYTPRLETVNGGGHMENPVVGYVEPVPEFYSRILALTKMTRTGLTDLQVLNETETSRLDYLETTLERLLDISILELEGVELEDDDYEFIRNFGENLDSIVTGVKDKGKETTIIADVHTDANTEQVLEEGIGYVDLIVVAYKVPDGRILTGAGPVFSYYEFKQPLDNRLTDEAWKDILDTNEPDRPLWTASFLAE